jgi:phenylpyruvate tautomerase PptA (4-oxalocrotonate tautomerase family)
MPIIDIELVSATQAPAVPGVAQVLADALGDALEVEAGKVWVRMRALPAANYAENRATAPEPAFVTIIAGAPPTGEALRRQVAQITEIVARHTHRPPELVHVLFEPAARGRIAFGGRPVE